MYYVIIKLRIYIFIKFLLPTLNKFTVQDNTIPGWLPLDNKCQTYVVFRTAFTSAIF